MENKEFHISLKCFFCGSYLNKVSKKECKSGDVLKCQECGELNDYDSLKDVAIEEGKAAFASYAKGEISNMLKDIFKK
jgi:hypothetical protein